MWKVNGIPLTDLSILGDFKPIEILDEYDEPLSFTSKDAAGGLLLTHNLAGSNEVLRYVAVVFDEVLLDRYKRGLLDVFGALHQPRAWVVDLSHDWQLSAAWAVRLADLPPEVLPQRGVMLYSHLEPLFRIRLVGPQFGEGKTSASSLRRITAITEDALKRVAEIVTEQERKKGRTAASLKRYFDLGMQTMAAASLELAFARPPTDNAVEKQTDARVLEEMGRLLNAGIAAANGDPTDFDALNLARESQVSLLEAIKELSPSKESKTKEVFVSGQLFGARRSPQLLTRKSRRATHERIKTLRANDPPQNQYLYATEGVISQADRDNYFFFLRDLTYHQRLDSKHEVEQSDEATIATTEIRFDYGPELDYDVVSAFVQGLLVNVYSIQDGKKRYRALDIFMLTPNERDAEEDD